MDALLGTSTSLCPECMRAVACTYEAEDGRVVQSKTCAEHGAFRTKIWDDVEHWQWTQSLESPACDIDGCGPEGAAGRRKCLAVVDVTQNCNLACDYCFASSRPGLDDVPRDRVIERLRTVLRASGGPTPIQLSGGEPTVRDDLPGLVRAAREMGFTHIEVNSNGIRLAQEASYAQTLKDAGVSVVYLQCDAAPGRKDAGKVYKTLRNADLSRVKPDAIENCRQAGLQVILVPMVVPGVNEGHLGDVVRYALGNLDVVRGVNIQPVSHFGRHADDTGHLSLPAVHALLEQQTGFLTADDLLQVPCCGPQCSSATMLLSMGDKDGKPHAVPLTRFVSDQAYRDVVAAFEERNFMDLLAGQEAGVSAAKDAAGCCGIPVPDGLERFLPRMLAVTVTGFMDADNVDVRRLAQCCINVPTDDGQLVPFCGYNLTTRGGDYALRRQYAAQAARKEGGLPVVS